ncbi:Cytochrome bo(3) ubiquinol oxidase subunit 2 precursor [Marinomonas spartinae]|uniref:Ubiquinol oxidase subunit 2 n=1 Tax=Marinomonas spartinae TaxID=1792290 RepID=A0A1A8T3S0_9GAMM|nr:ubiquinol oxidase subunit II [Marinomonas spartinae]SBS25458.1 Cytochrome bo(3) ubiquinol oxidase subunit 2 precursor [Marinomonas spartinae]SBS39571.1 Cytochrome bo(3) ubiquinol oxidase subunit 2 precursor [Marinomonas spartinae]
MILLLTRILSKIALAITVALLAGCQGGVLDPKGQVGIEEKQLIIVATVLMLLVVIPVIFMTLYFAWKYREGRNEIYEPKWSHSTKIEAIVWTIPIIIVIILGVITWKSTHALDPYKPLKSDKDHINVQVVSMNWKWLFIYPDLGIASVNELRFPANVPVSFQITSEATMNSFFIPQLGSQIYSMAGMITKLHLIANEPGTYKGYSANYSGPGFTGMKFNAIAMDSEADFDKWVEGVKAGSISGVKNNGILDQSSYDELAKYDLHAHVHKPTPVQYYSSIQPGIFMNNVMKFMKDYGTVDILEGTSFDVPKMRQMKNSNMNQGGMSHGEMSHGEMNHGSSEDSSHKMHMEEDK